MTDPENFLYGSFRKPNYEVNNIDMSHVKRIRQSEKESDKLEIIVTTKSHWESEDCNRERLREML